MTISNGVKITVFVHPNSKKPRIDKDLPGSLHVYVSQPPTLRVKPTKRLL